jgi:hypothetical protein
VTGSAQVQPPALASCNWYRDFTPVDSDVPGSEAVLHGPHGRPTRPSLWHADTYPESASLSLSLSLSRGRMLLHRLIQFKEFKEPKMKKIMHYNIATDNAL